MFRNVKETEENKNDLRLGINQLDNFAIKSTRNRKKKIETKKLKTKTKYGKSEGKKQKQNRIIVLI